MGEDAQMMEKIRLYIEGGLDAAGNELVEKALRESRELFDFYIELKEALFLKARGGPASPGMEKRVIGLASGKGLPHCSLIVRFLPDRVSVSSGGSGDLKFYGAQAAFKSGSGSSSGPVTITRQVAGREMTLTVHPPAGDENYCVSAVVPGEKLDAVLVLDGREAETLRDVSSQKMFGSGIPVDTETGLSFMKNGMTVFTVGLRIRNG